MIIFLYKGCGFQSEDTRLELVHSFIYGLFWQHCPMVGPTGVIERTVAMDRLQCKQEKKPIIFPSGLPVL